MALIKCEDCGKKFSDKAAACPECGRPMESVVTSSATVALGIVRAVVWIICAIAVLVIVSLLMGR